MTRQEEQSHEKMAPNRDALARDGRLVDEIRGGSDPAWREFLDRYNGLIYGVLRRHLVSEDVDEIRNIHVGILKSLHDGELFKYQNRSSLATWLTVLSRAKAFDYRRKVRGRRRVPREVDRLSRIEKQVLQLYFVERLSLDIVLHTLHWKGYHVQIDDVVDAINRIEERLDRRFLRRLDEEAAVRISGAASVRVLKFLSHLRAEQQRDNMNNAPDRALMEAESRSQVERVRKIVAGLEEEEQEIVNLRYGGKLPARAIAESMGLENTRKVYTILERLLARFKASLQEDDAG